MRNTEEEKHVIKDDEETFETLETFKRHGKTNLSYDKSKCKSSKLFIKTEHGFNDIITQDQHENVDQDHARQAEKYREQTRTLLDALEQTKSSESGATSNPCYDKNKSFFDSVSSSSNSAENPNGLEATSVASYDKNKSFFDSISTTCSATEKVQEGQSMKKDCWGFGKKWKKETPGDFPVYNRALQLSLGYKIVMCEAFRRGSCHFGDSCNFAHGIEELKPAMTNEEMIYLEHRTRSNIEKRISQLRCIQFEAEYEYSHYLLNSHLLGNGRNSIETKIEWLGNILVNLDNRVYKMQQN